MDAPLAATVKHMSTHVLQQLARHRARMQANSGPASPLFVAVQGPQGSGKTFLTTRLQEALAASPHSLSVAVLSIDDLYLPHSQLAAVAQANPHNRLLHGRGQPGTHDVKLGTQILSLLKRINEPEGSGGTASVEIPQFDKSLFGGEGDRAESGTVVRPPLDIVVLEGWCVGFYPSTSDEIERRWELPVQGLGADFFHARGFRKEDVLDVNERLKEYLDWWTLFDAFIQVWQTARTFCTALTSNLQIKPVESHPYDYIYKWRLQQEHNMKARNGGKGMSDEQVEK